MLKFVVGEFKSKSKSVVKSESGSSEGVMFRMIFIIYVSILKIIKSTVVPMFVFFFMNVTRNVAPS